MDNQQETIPECMEPCNCYVVARREGLFGEWIHVYVLPSPLVVHLKLSQHCLLINYVVV